MLLVCPFACLFSVLPHVSCWVGVVSIRLVIFLKLKSKWEISSPSPDLISCATMQRQLKGALRSVKQTFFIPLFRGVFTYFTCLKVGSWNCTYFILIFDFTFHEWSTLHFLSLSCALRYVAEGKLPVAKQTKKKV